MKMKNKKTYIVIFLIIIIDLISKILVTKFMAPNQSISIIKNFFSITYVKNTGVAFSMLEGNIFFIIILTFFIVWLIFRYINSRILNSFECFSYGLIVGGALGNLFDRIRLGYVIDFFDFNIIGYNFAIFNVADIAIVVGVFLIIVFSIRGECYGNKSK